MTNEEKELLLKDLCSRLPYGVMLKTDNVFPQKLEGISFDNDPFVFFVSDGGYTLDWMDCKPYLFPISSMTEEQLEEFEKCGLEGYHDYDWYNKNHFDYRGLIEEGLAIDATNKNIY